MAQKISFQQYIKAGYPVLWVETHEDARAIANLKVEGWTTFQWDVLDGLRKCGSDKVTECGDPVTVIKKLVAKSDHMGDHSILFVMDFHRYIDGIEVVRAIKNAIPELKGSNQHLVIVSPVVKIPVELEKDITVMSFELPTAEEINTVAKYIIRDNESLHGLAVDEKLGGSGRGMTLAEAENALALSLVTSKEKLGKPQYDASVIQDEKLQMIKKSGMMELAMPEPLENLGGLDTLKKYLGNRKAGFEAGSKLPTPKGILIVGLPGGGKSLVAKVAASILQMPLIRLDIAALRGSLVGQSEMNMRKALAVISAVSGGFSDGVGSGSGAVIWLDEVEKVLGGVQSSAKTDGGTTASMFGTLLTWMQESKSSQYLIATCNDIKELLAVSQGAFLRRFDDVFFVDVPTKEERREILAIKNRQFGTKFAPELADKLDGWTGAEIERLVKNSQYDGVEDALANIHPIYEQNKDIIEEARRWAASNARLANAVPVKNTTVTRKIAQ